MEHFISRWLVLTIAAGVMVTLLPGMHAVGEPPILGIGAFALFLALINASIKPIVHTIALPFSILSFGLIALIINWLFMELASWLAISLFDVGVTIDGFWWSVIGSLIMAIVSGIVTPDNLWINKHTGEVTTEYISEKETMVVRLNERGGTKEIPVPEDQREAPVLTDDERNQLVTLANRIEAFYKKPEDIEWAIVDGQVYLLQSRPITTMK